MSGPRLAAAADIPRISALQGAAYARNRPLLGVEPLPLQADLEERLAGAEIWLFENGAALEGALFLEDEPDALLIWSVATAPEAQGRGVGGRMLDFAEVRAREKGFSLLRLYTGKRLASNVEWYLRRGFGVDRVETLADREIVHMKKPLARA